MRIIYEATAGSTNEDVVFELLDNANTVLVSAVAPNGTASGQQTWEVNLVPVVTTLGAVRKIRLSVADGGDMMGTGTILFDDISISSGTYSTCRSCQGEFMGKPYVAFTDGQQWNPDLHDVHRATMLNFDCATCHTLPNFFTPDAAHPNKPVNACSGAERFVSPLEGLDNDGDLLYERADTDCQQASPAPALGNVALVFLFGLLLVVGFWRLRLSK